MNTDTKIERIAGHIAEAIRIAGILQDNNQATQSIDPQRWTIPPGSQIIYVPDHADGIDHPDAESGFVEFHAPGESDAYCRFWKKEGNELRTKSNSEKTPIPSLRFVDTESPTHVRRMLSFFCKQYCPNCFLLSLSREQGVLECTECGFGGGV